MEREALIQFCSVAVRNHCPKQPLPKGVLVFIQLSTGFEFKFSSLVEFSSQFSQPLCYFKFSYYFSVLMKINESCLQKQTWHVFMTLKSHLWSLLFKRRLKPQIGFNLWRKGNLYTTRGRQTNRIAKIKGSILCMDSYLCCDTRHS